ncbi:MAG: C40 family peptidase [Candidatus Fermentibacter sp.]|nr:C40 family peptidase [Candidatus Fermentibacter sp.]
MLVAALIALRTIVAMTLDPDSGLDGPAAAAPADSAAVLVDSLIADAMSYVGTPYVYGGTGPDGFDCSGLICRVFSENGIELPRTVTAMESMGVTVARDSLLPGDLLIFESPKHVGMYLGDGLFIHSSSYQDRGVVVTELAQANYARRYSSARRMVGFVP